MTKPIYRLMTLLLSLSLTCSLVAARTQATVIFTETFPTAASLSNPTLTLQGDTTTTRLYWSDGAGDGIPGPAHGGMVYSEYRDPHKETSAYAYMIYKIHAPAGKLISDPSATITFHTAAQSVRVTLASSADGSTWKHMKRGSSPSKDAWKTVVMTIDQSTDASYDGLSTIYYRIGMPTFRGAAGNKVGDKAAVLDRVQIHGTLIPAPDADSRATSKGASPSDHATQNAHLKVTSSVLFKKDFPLSACVDGDTHTAALPSPLQKQKHQNVKADYVFTFGKPTRIRGVRFIQHPYCFANRYKIVANTTGKGGVFDKVLVQHTAEGVVPTGQWVEKDFQPATVYALKFEPISGFGFGKGGVFPGLVEFQVVRSSAPVTSASAKSVPVIHASVDLDTVWSINGHDTFENSMFAVANADRSDIAKRWLKPLNLGMVPIWFSFFAAEGPPIGPTIAQQPGRPGHFDPNYFTSDAFNQYFQAWLKPKFDTVANMGATVNLRLVDAPPYMRQSLAHPTGPKRFIKSKHFFPPEDPAEWGRLAGLAIRTINQKTHGTIQWVHIWNEPNTSVYLPVPWPKKASTYFHLYRQAAMQIRKLNPSIKIAGPVLSGEGIFGWVPPDRAINGWSDWVKPFIDQCGKLAEGFDAHLYHVDANCLLAESQLVANYAHDQLGKPLPIISTEGNFILGTKHPGVDPLATRWQFITVNWANLLFNALNAPQRIKSLAYFYIQDIGGYYGMFNDDLTQPHPIYWFYRLVSNLRGQRLWTSTNGDKINLLAARRGKTINLVVQNKRGVPVEVALDLHHAGGFKIISAKQLAYSPAAGKVQLSSLKTRWDGQILYLQLRPYGMGSVITQVARNKPFHMIAEKTHYANKVFQPLGEGKSIVFNINVPKNSKAVNQVMLRFGTTGIPHSRPRTMEDRRVPLSVNINGHLLPIVAAGEYNEVHVPTSYVKGRNSIVLHRIAYDGNDSRIVNPDKFWILSCAMVTTAARQAYQQP